MRRELLTPPRGTGGRGQVKARTIVTCLDRLWDFGGVGLTVRNFKKGLVGT